MARLRLLSTLLLTLCCYFTHASHDLHHNDIEPSLRILFPPQALPTNSHDLWDKIRSGFEIPSLNMAEVAAQERYYSKHPEYINRIVSRGSRYLYYIVSEIQRRSMPMELALLPIVESAYNPRAESSARASGIWQFIPSTGKMYGLERTWWYDGRRDIIAATDAALDYLQRLYDTFGDWHLALAAYNWGDGSVKRAQAKNSAQGRPVDYTAIKMPNETRNYVPKLLAIRNIIANPLAFGVKLATIPNQPYFTAVKPERHMDVHIAATLAEISVDELLHLNPGYIRPVIAHKENRKLILPVEKVEIFKKNLAQYDKPLLNWQPYTTKRGESFKSIAEKHGIELEVLRKVNSLPLHEHKARGQALLVPRSHQITPTAQKTSASIAANKEGHPMSKNWVKVARDQISSHPPKEANPPSQPHTQDFWLFQDSDHPSHPMTPPALKEGKTLRYQVKKGETLYRIAQNFHLSVDELKKANRLQDNYVQSGQVILIPQASNP